MSEFIILVLIYDLYLALLFTLLFPIDSKILRIQYLLIYESGETAFKGFLPKHH